MVNEETALVENAVQGTLFPRHVPLRLSDRSLEILSVVSDGEVSEVAAACRQMCDECMHF